MEVKGYENMNWGTKVTVVPSESDGRFMGVHKETGRAIIGSKALLFVAKGDFSRETKTYDNPGFSSKRDADRYLQSSGDERFSAKGENATIFLTDLVNCPLNSVEILGELEELPPESS